MIGDPIVPGEFHFATLDYAKCHPTDIEPGRMGRLTYACPRNGQECGNVIIGNGMKPPGGKPTWQWDGNADAPTLTPSINCLSHGPNGEKYAGCGWHGWLTAGVFKD